MFFVIDLVFAIPDFHINDIIQAAKIAGSKAVSVMLILGILQVVYIRKNKISLADFGINPTQSAVFNVDKSIDETKDIIEQIVPNKISSSKFSYDKAQGFYKAKTRTSVLSWGEKIVIELKELGHSKVQLSVLSKPALRTTLVDFGKSSMNIQKIKRVFGQV